MTIKAKHLANNFKIVYFISEKVKINQAHRKMKKLQLLKQNSMKKVAVIRTKVYKEVTVVQTQGEANIKCKDLDQES